MKEEPDALEIAVGESFDTSLNDHECMLLFGILHNRSVQFSDGGVWCAVTQRHAGACLAAIWQNGNPSLRDSFRWGELAKADYVHWYWQWAEWNGEVCFHHLTEHEQRIVDRLQSQLEQHPSIRRIGPDIEDDPEFWTPFV